MAKKMPHSTFRLKNSNSLTTGFGYLTPFFFQPVVPGDRLSLRSQIDIQMMPMAAPIYQSCKAFVHYYYVPSRVVHINEEWSAFESRESRKLATMVTIPNQLSYTTVGDLVLAANSIFTNSGSGAVIPTDYSIKVFLNTILDYLRIQGATTVSDFSNSTEKVILEPLFAYFKVYLDHYVSTRVDALIPESTDLSGVTKVRTLSYDDLVYIFSYCQTIGFDKYVAYGQAIDTSWASNTSQSPSANTSLLAFLLGIGYVLWGRSGDMFQNLYPSSEAAATSQTIGTTVESLRLANTVQKYNERKARVGHGIGEFLWEFFHVKSSDARLQRSQFLGGGRRAIAIDDVLQTSEDTSSSALGELAGNGHGHGSFGFGRRYFEDYGYVFGFIYILPKQAYYQGIDNLWSRLTADDLYLEAFDAIGDESVKKKEIFFANNSQKDNGDLGYQPRYDRYKYAKDEVHGDFCDSLMYWHANRQFTVHPGLKEIRTTFGSSINRVFNAVALANTHAPRPIMVFVKNKAKWRRKMRYTSFPKLT